MSNNEKDQIAVGILLDSLYVAKYEYDFLNWVHSHERFDLKAVFIAEDRPSHVFTWMKYVNFIRRLPRRLIFKCIILFERFLLSFDPIHHDHLRRIELREDFFPIHRIQSNQSASGVSVFFDERSIQKIGDFSLDLIVNFKSRIIRGQILSSSAYGVVGIHHGSRSEIKGGPAGFWEVFERRNRSGFMIQVLSESLDSGKAIMEGFFSTKSFFLLNQANIRLKTSFYLKKVFEEFSQTREFPIVEDVFVYSSQLFTMPNVIQQFRYLVGFFYRSFKRVFRKIFRISEQRWKVGFVAESWPGIQLRKFNALDVGRESGLADPFVFWYKSQLYMLAEEINRKLKRGRIVLFKYDEGNGFQFANVAIEEPWHLSYPFPFLFEGKLYCVPESAEKREIMVYEASEDLTTWRQKTVIMSNVDAVDSTIIFHEDTWWLFTNIDPMSNGDHSSELHLFYSKNPLSTDWKPHPKNPIAINPDGGRMGGVLIKDEMIFRVGQRHAFGVYGESLIVFRIEVLSHEDYEEVREFDVRPKFRSSLSRIHHIHGVPGMTVFDFFGD